MPWKSFQHDALQRWTPHLTTAVRKLFPNPVCLAAQRDPVGGVECVRLGHYTGFRTAAESQARREGQVLDRS